VNRSGLFSIVFTLVILVSARAQPSGDYLKFGLGYAFQTVLDQSLSPVSYSGHFGQLNLGYYSQNDKWISELDLAGMGGIQKPDVLREEGNRQTLSGLTRLRYTLARQWTDFGVWRFYAGLSSMNTFDFRNHSNYVNSQSNFTALFALGPSAGLQREFEMNERIWGLQVFVDLPVAGYYLRPGYIKPFHNDEVGSKGLVWWGEYFQVNTRTDLIFYLKNENQLRLIYNWEFIGLQPLNKIQSGTHQLSLCAVFKF
jgi:hypothetical protein